LLKPKLPQSPTKNAVNRDIAPQLETPIDYATQADQIIVEPEETKSRTQAALTETDKADTNSS